MKKTFFSSSIYAKQLSQPSMETIVGGNIWDADDEPSGGGSNRGKPILGWEPESNPGDRPPIGKR